MPRHSDLFDVLANIAFSLPTKTHAQRVAERKARIVRAQLSSSVNSSTSFWRIMSIRG
ncbi:MAG: hypothetical protein R3E89_03225 [Thiolinea sp.]